MKKLCVIVLAASVTSGCNTLPKPAEVIAKDYTTVNFQDGIAQEEAVIIAKKEVIDSTPPQSYVVGKPRIMTEFESIPHQDQYWFVAFEEIERGQTPVVYMVTIRKDTGKIVFSRSYSPLNEWVLEAALLKLHEKPAK